MKRKIEIPAMDSKDIVRWYKTIKPIVLLEGKPVFLRQLTENELIKKELTSSGYKSLKKSEDYGEEVEFSKLSVLADVKMLHRWTYYGFFKPSFSEVIRQIPSELIEKTVAFQIIYKPEKWQEYNLFKEEFDANYHVYIVRLYKTKDNSNIEAKPILKYPEKNSTTPIGMSEEEFGRVKEIVAKRN